VAESVTEVDEANVSLQVAPPEPHVSPPPVTVPPVGAGLIVSEYDREPAVSGPLAGV
jgi:hypothetical protein